MNLEVKTFIFTNDNKKGLKNLLQSLPEVLKKNVYIFDDNSKYSLGFLPKFCKINKANRNRGLFANISLAIEKFVDDSDFVLLLQDDTEIVAPLTEQDLLDYCEFIEVNELDEIDIRFVKSTGYGRYLQENLQIIEGGYRNRLWSYTDIGLWKGKSLRSKLLPKLSDITEENKGTTSASWGKERWLSQELLRENFKSCLHRNPFVAHTPFPSYRYNKLSTRLHNALVRVFPKKFRKMSPDEWARFQKRPLVVLPMDYLFLSLEKSSNVFFYPVQPGFRQFKALIKHP